MGGGGFAVDDSAVAVFDGEAVVCGASTVYARVEDDGCGAARCGGVEGDDGGFTSASPRGGGHVVVVVRPCDGGVFCHGLCLVCVGGLFACVLDACAGDPRVGDGADCVAAREGDGGGVAASFVGARVVVQGCVYGDGASVFARHVVTRAHGLVGGLAIEATLIVIVVVAWCEGEYAVRRACDGFANQHVGERLLLAPHPFVDLALCERYADGGERLVLVAWGGEGAGGDVGAGGADGGGHGFSLVEEDECEAGDGARVAHVGVEVCALDDAAVCFCAHRLNTCVLVAVVCARRVGGYTSGVAAECDGEVGAVAECDDVAVVACHVAAVEEFVEVGGELVCVAGSVLCGACWCEAVFDVVPRVHCWSLFLSVASRLFSFVYAGCVLSPARVYLVTLFARVFLLVMVP